MMNKAFMRQAQKLQQKLAQAEEELEKVTVEGSAGGGAVTVVVTGKQRVTSVRISREAVDPDDLGLLEDLVQAATNEALEKAQGLAASRLGALTGGLKIPGLT